MPNPPPAPRGDERLAADLASLARLTAPPREPASVRLERELGPDVARRLVATLVRR